MEAESGCWAGESVSVVICRHIHLARFDQEGKYFVVSPRENLCHASNMAKAPPVKWTREHTFIALNLYTKLKFGQFDSKNPVIREVAAKMGRPPGSLSMKLCNFASLDPVQRARGIKGLEGASRQDREMWQEIRSNSLTMGTAAEELFHDLFTKDQAKDVVVEDGQIKLVPPSGPTETQATVKIRRGQQFFRQAVLTAYDVRCCISGINVPRLLVASHIKPWGKFPDERLNPRNGLCLSSLHDAAFDNGLITLDEDLRVVLSNRLQKFFPEPALEQNFVPYEGKPIRLPEKLAEPDGEFLRYHRMEIFRS